MKPPSVRLAKTLLAIAGYAPGLSQPAVGLDLIQGAPVSFGAADLAKLDAVFAKLLGTPIPPMDDSADPIPLPHALLRWNRALQTAGGWPVFADGLVAPLDDSLLRHALVVPCLSGAFGAAADALQWVIGVVNLALAGRASDEAGAVLPRILAAMHPFAPQGMNTLRFLQAAHDAGIPWRHLQGNVYQFGWGTRGRWLDSSFTDATTHLGSRLARHKFKAAIVLRRAGIPVPDHVMVGDADAAVKAAAGFGYPVVVKPANLEQGQGVAAGLRSAGAVRRAFATARALSAEILVERHFEGNDYRLVVFRGEVIWVSHRVPGGVTGDGAGTVAALLAALNADPRRRPEQRKLKHLEMDEEARELLAEQGLTADSIPERDRFVRLRRASNVATGGQSLPVREGAHPDNLALAVRAAQALRLDLAGIDLLIPDIRRSWLETGAAICEVNAQPQLWPTLPALILPQLVSGGGRIPVIVVVGTPGDAGWVEQLARRLGPAHGRVGVARRNQATLGGEVLAPGPCQLLAATEVLLLHPQTDLLLILLEDFEALENGLPVDRFDTLILASGAPAGSAAPQWPDPLTVAGTVAPMCRGHVYVNAACPEWLSLLDSMPGRITQSASLAEIEEIVAQGIRPQ